MTITTTVLGDNTKKLSMSGEANSQSIITGINSTLATMGWALYDTKGSTDGGAANAHTLYNGLVTCVYRAVCADATNYKYTIIRYDTIKQLMYMSCSEGWSIGSKAPINECWTGAGVPMGFRQDNCDILINANARWLWIQTFLHTVPSTWSMVTEFEREALEDTPAAGVPCFAYISPSFVCGIDDHANTDTYSYGLNFPRLRDGSTGYYAASRMRFSSASRLFLHYNNRGGIGLPINQIGGTYGWDNGKKQVHTLSAVSGYVSSYTEDIGSFKTGRMYGAKLTNITNAAHLDQVELKVDGSLFHDPSGTNATHVVIHFSGANGPGGVYRTASQNGDAECGAIARRFTACGSGTIVNAVTSDGKNMYFATSSGVYKVNAATMASTYNSTIAANNCYDIQYDGARYVYAAGSVQLWRIDTTTDVVDSLALANGCMNIAIDANYIVCASRIISTSNPVHVVSRATFTAVSGSPFANPFVAPYGQQYGQITTDYNGGFYFANNCDATAYNSRIYRFEASASGFGYTGQYVNNVASNDKTGCIYSPVNDLVYCWGVHVNTAQYFKVMSANRAFSLVNAPSTTGLSTSFTAGATATPYKVSMFIRGGAVYISTANTTATATAAGMNVHVPSTNVANGYLINVSRYQCPTGTDAAQESHYSLAYDGNRMIWGQLGKAMIIDSTNGYHDNPVNGIFKNWSHFLLPI